MTNVVEDNRRELVITPEVLERIKRHKKAERSPEAIKLRKETRRKVKQFNRLIKEMDSVSKTGNLKLQKALQIIEELDGKHVRAMYAKDWLDDTITHLKKYDNFTPRENKILLDRINFLKKMSFRAGDVYEEWDRTIDR
jgi:hypothetical protein